MAWFGVKCIFTMAIARRGSTKRKACEERIILVKAKGFDEAIAAAEHEALEYAATSQWINRDGRRVSTRYLGTCDAFVLSDKLGSGAEVYSKLFFVRGSATNAQLADRFLGSLKEQPSSRHAEFEPDFESVVAAKAKEKKQCSIKKKPAVEPTTGARHSKKSR